MIVPFRWRLVSFSVPTANGALYASSQARTFGTRRSRHGGNGAGHSLGKVYE